MVKTAKKTGRKESIFGFQIDGITFGQDDVVEPGSEIRYFLRDLMTNAKDEIRLVSMKGATIKLIAHTNLSEYGIVDPRRQRLDPTLKNHYYYVFEDGLRVFAPKPIKIISEWSFQFCEDNSALA